MGTAIIVRVDGTKTPLQGRPSLKEAQGIVGGYIEFVKVGKNITLVVDEEGRVKQKPINREITQRYGHLIYGGYIVGDVLVLEGWRTVGS